MASMVRLLQLCLVDSSGRLVVVSKTSRASFFSSFPWSSCSRWDEGPTAPRDVVVGVKLVLCFHMPVGIAEGVVVLVVG